jgi:hypothetical protein
MSSHFQQKIQPNRTPETPNKNNITRRQTATNFSSFDLEGLDNSKLRKEKETNKL